MSSDSASRNGTDPRARITIERVVVLGYILAGAMPPFGLAIALGLGAKRKSKHWRWIALVSLLAAVVWAAVIASGALSSTNNQGY